MVPTLFSLKFAGLVGFALFYTSCLHYLGPITPVLAPEVIRLAVTLDAGVVTGSLAGTGIYKDLSPGFTRKINVLNVLCHHSNLRDFFCQIN
jgi:hypothetical protein